MGQIELSAFFYGAVGAIIFCIGLHGLVYHDHFIRKTIGMNIMGAGLFLSLVALANRSPDGVPDPVPHGMVLTGIVVSVSATALLLAMIMYLFLETGETDFKGVQKQKEKSDDRS